jgi:hypothetical protein
MRRLRIAASGALLALTVVGAFIVESTAGTAEWIWAGVSVGLLVASRLLDPGSRG